MTREWREESRKLESGKGNSGYNVYFFKKKKKL